VAQGVIEAQLANCQFLFDYGEVIDLYQVLRLRYKDWKVPKGFRCDAINDCRSLSPPRNDQPSAWSAPYYRPVFKNISRLNVERAKFRHLEQSLPGFQLEIGFACAFNSMLQLSPAATQFQPNLFNELLLTLRDPKNLVLAIYIRTGFTDQASLAEMKGTVARINTQRHEDLLRQTVTCALKLEKNLLRKRDYSRIVWMIITDSSYVKHSAMEGYASEVLNYNDNPTTVSRIVLTTGSRGMHSRPERNPSTVDFAESMIDWYLIGESDTAVLNGVRYTFPSTGSMRTNRPVYDSARNCSLMTWLHDDAAEERIT
jgi:hypothetical protein